jgi:oxygen-dependent protoporphyrinogen oxidase
MSVVIVGGGIAGLATAYRLRQGDPSLPITLVERDPQLGGKIVTAEQDGFVIEGGPDSFLAQQKPWGLALARELGLSERLLFTNDERRNVYLLRRKRLRKMPDGLMLIVPTRFLPFALSSLISLPGKLRMALDLFIPPRRDEADESLGDFIRRRLGQEALDVLAEPMMAGIHVAEAERLSLQATFPRFSAIERKYGSLIRGMLAARKARAQAPPGETSLFVTLQGGLRELVAALEEALDGVEILAGRGVTALERADGGYSVHLDDGDQRQADAVVLAIPAYATADLLAPLSAPLADGLRAIRYVSTATVSLGFRREDVPHPLDGFGFVVPASEPCDILACTWTSTKFDYRAPDDAVLLRAFVGGPRGETQVAQDDAAIIRTVQAEFRRILGIEAQPTVARVFRWRDANPQYDVGHLERVSALEALCPPGLFLTGSAYRGVGIPDCVRQGSETAAKVCAYLDAECDYVDPPAESQAHARREVVTTQ